MISRKKARIGVLALLAACGPALVFAGTGTLVFAGTGSGNLGSIQRTHVLYAPSESDDPVFRADLAAALGGAAVADYFDASLATPDAALLETYDCVMTWTDFAYADAELFGDRLADYVDQGGTVILGAFCAYTSGSHLGGRIMADAAYCPVTGGYNHYAFSAWDGSCAGDCLYAGVANLGATFRDVLTLRSGASCGRFADGEIAVAYNEARSVVYANGAGGSPLDGGAADWPELLAKACFCSGPVASEPQTWGAIKAFYR